MKTCVYCEQPLGESPFTICYDPAWRENVWGGDTHAPTGWLCLPCGEGLSEPGLLREAREEEGE